MPTQRMSTEALGEFIPGPPPRYRIKRVPLPPEIRTRATRLRPGHTIREEVSIDVACPHCMKDVTLAFVAAEALPSMIARLNEALAALSSIEFQLATAAMGNDPRIRTLIATAQELHQALKPW